MEASILKELYFGNIRPQENSRLYEREYLRLKDRAGRAYEELGKQIRKYQSELEQQLELFLEQQLELSSYENEAAFIEGFRLGARIMMEVLQGGQENEGKADS